VPKPRGALAAATNEPRKERDAANVTPRRWCSAEGLQPRTNAGRRQVQWHVSPPRREILDNIAFWSRRSDPSATGALAAGEINFFADEHETATYRTMVAAEARSGKVL